MLLIPILVLLLITDIANGWSFSKPISQRTKALEEVSLTSSKLSSISLAVGVASIVQVFNPKIAFADEVKVPVAPIDLGPAPADFGLKLDYFIDAQRVC